MAKEFARSFESAFRYLLPSPLAIALLLSFLAFLLVWFLGPDSLDQNFTKSIDYWIEGLWQAPLLVFMVQMMLILVLGHSLALSSPIKKIISRLLRLATTPEGLSALVCFFSLFVSLFNWGLGLVFGAIFARQAGLKLSQLNIKFNYGLLGAAGYSGLMVWHGGFSGSAPLKVAEENHLEQLMQGINLNSLTSKLPLSIGIEETLLSPMNIFTAITLLIIIPLVVYNLAKVSTWHKVAILESSPEPTPERDTTYGAEKLDSSSIFGLSLGIAILAINVNLTLKADGFSFMTLNFINLSLLALCFTFHGSLRSFLNALDQAIGGAAGILVQFPLYFGIMGLMSNSGLISQLSLYFSSISNAGSFPILSFFSAGLVNIFVPSGGGQWAIQGTILIETALRLDIPLGKAVMALAYGDQLTNMLQPFWALPLLAITQLKAREIIPYTLLIMLVGIVIFTASLVIF
jgi:short-chain fatty acids transporter